jgi:hypothetical protein
MHSDPAAIDDYIKAYRGTYTDEAMRENLLAAGHELAAIDEAFMRAGPLDGSTTTQAARASSETSGLVVFAWILFVLGGILGLVGIGMAASFGSGGSLPLPLFLIAYVGIGFGIILLLRWAVARFGIRGVWGGVLGLLLVPFFGALMFGTCAAAFTIGRG